MDSSNENNERMHILEMIEQGRISPEEGLDLLKALNSAEQVWNEPESKMPGVAESASKQEVSVNQKLHYLPPLEHPQSGGIYQERGAPKTWTRSSDVTGEKIRKWENWWMIPLWIGTAITVFGGLFMYLAQRSSGVGFWFVCAAVPFALGLALIVLAWQSRSAPWLHLRVQQRPGKSPERIAFSFPLPVQTAAWFIRSFGWMIPGMAGQNWDQLIQEVGARTNSENPISILVDEGESGERVEIYIG